MPSRTHLPRPPVNRRTFVWCAGALGAMTALGGCSPFSGDNQLSFFQSKPEVIGYFDDLLADFVHAHPGVGVEHDSTSNLSAGFVRHNPPDLGCLNYNFEIARFVRAGALSDLSDLPAADRVNPDLRPIIALTADYPGRTSVIPYSLMGAAVLYNREIFEENGFEVPRTWSEMVELCEACRDADITPIYSTFSDPWTIGQGLFDYSVGGMIDVGDFFTKLRAQGADVGPNSAVSFQKDFLKPVQRMLKLAKYSNGDAASRGYGDGNLAFSQGKSAMYLQGPWALTEIAKTNEDMKVGAFPLPMTDDPDDRKVRVNIDLALWIPEMSKDKDGARELLAYLMQPDVINPYNDFANGFGVTVDAPPTKDPTLQDIQPYYDAAAFYLGASQLVPQSIPIHNYVQGMVFGADPAETLATIDADWARLAFRNAA